MKAFYRQITALCLSITIMFMIIGPAAAQGVEIRGPVFDGSDIDNIIDAQGNGEDVKVDATQFAAFDYDIDDKVTTETIQLPPLE